MTRRLVLLAFVLFACPALAAEVDWSMWCGGGTATNLSPGNYACAIPTSNAHHTKIIRVGRCENIDAGLSEDSNGDGTGGTAFEATLQWCPVGPDDATVNTDAERAAACVDFDSGTLTGDGTIQGAGPPTGFVRFEVGGTFAGDPRLWIRCND